MMIEAQNVLTFVNPFGDDVYKHRSETRDLKYGNLFTDYFIMILSGAILPFLLARGMVSKNNKEIFFAVLIFVFLYLIGANKQYVFTIIFFWLLLFIFNLNFSTIFGRFIIFWTALVFSVCFFYFIVFPKHDNLMMNVEILSEVIIIEISMFLLA